MSHDTLNLNTGFTRRVHVLNEASALLQLGLPLALTHLSYIATISTDVLMMGWLGPEALGTGSLAWYLYVFFDYFALGVLCAVSPTLAQHLGARRTKDIRPTVRAGAWAAVMLTIPCLVILWHSKHILALLGQSDALAGDAQSYLRHLLFAMLPGLWLFVISELLAAHGRTRALLLTYIAGIGLNALANYALMFGHFGFPAMGLDGAGLATTVVYLFMFCALFGFVLVDRRMRRYRLLHNIWKIEGDRISGLLKLGLPIGFTEISEIGMFLVISLMMGLIGTNALAANAVAAQYCAIAFAATIGISQAATVRVGRAVGSGNTELAALSGWTAICLGAFISIAPAAAFLFLGEPLIALILDPKESANAGAIKLAVAVLAVGGLFQVADTVQGISIGALRAYNDTRGPLLITFTVYWGIALPAAALFGLALEHGAEGIWFGMVIGISLTGLLLLLRFRQKSKPHGGSHSHERQVN
ncbi:MAG: MATE family efflux transporter [Alphaproteobacteria bacterium]|nr:MATE family efflux transporter [Alphaproteobacteria bacterium]